MIHLTLCFEPRHLVRSCLDLQDVLDTIPRLSPELYAVVVGERTIGTAARHRSGDWTLTLDDGREFHGRVGKEPPRVGPGYMIV